VTGTTLAIVWPSISTTSMGRFDIGASSGSSIASVTRVRLRSHEQPQAWPASQRRAREISHFISVLNDTFTLLKNREFRPVLRDQINRAAIVAP